MDKEKEEASGQAAGGEAGACSPALLLL